jgi:hypothetical protein
MSGTGASNLGYGGTAPLSNVNGQYVNVTSSNNPANFSSNETMQTGFGLFGTKSNVAAAAGEAPGICLFKGGAKVLKRKIKNITKIYKKMKKGSKKMRSLKHKLRSRTIARGVSRGVSRGASRSVGRRFAGGKKRRTHSRHKGQRGGWAQYQNNLPNTPVYQVAGINLPASQLGLANPPPIKVLPNTGQCPDNYNHFTNMSSPSKGH